MSKIKGAVKDALLCGQWLDSNEIAARANCASKSVRSILTVLVRDGVVIKKEHPLDRRFFIYKIKKVTSEFGVNRKLARFQQLISTARPHESRRG